MPVTAYIVVDLPYGRQLKIDYDKSKDAKRDYEAFKKIKAGVQVFEFKGAITSTVDVPCVMAISLVDVADYDKRSQRVIPAAKQ
jgi:hypothetical protein